MITDSTIGLGDRLGAQLSKIAQLMYICRENGQKLVFWNELRNFRRGFCFLDAFNIDNIEYIERAGNIKGKILKFCNNKINKNNDDWLLLMNRMTKNLFYRCLYKFIYKWICWDYRDFQNIKTLKDDVHTNSSLLNLDGRYNYDINHGFGTYQDWKKYEQYVKDSIHFKNEIKQEGQLIFNTIANPNKKKIAIHLRKTDYLIVPVFVNLNDSYYRKAVSYFEPDECQFIVFSDDIEACKKTDFFKELIKKYEIVFMSQHSANVDMYIMTLCDGNIIANSTFSFWGAFLNKNKNKKVICPHDFICRNVKELSYINGNYYPDDWIAI